MGNQEGDQAMNGEEQDYQENDGIDGSYILRGLRFQPPEAFDGSDNKFELFFYEIETISMSERHQISRQPQAI